MIPDTIVHVQYLIPHTIITNIFYDLFLIIDKWKGVSLRRTKHHKINTFKEYFNIGKKWYDARKTKALGTVFWVRIFAHIKHVCMNILYFLYITHTFL